MSYTVTRRERYPSFTVSSAPFGRILSSYAAVTLGGARHRAHVDAAIAAGSERGSESPWKEVFASVRNLPQGGGTITLPDGTIIEVESRETRQLWPHNDEGWMGKTDEEIAAAYNEAQGGNDA